MIRLLLVIAAVLCLSFTLSISLIRAKPYEIDSLASAFSNPADCLRPCWQSIRPGETTRDAALAIVQQSAWARNVMMDEFWIRWYWSGTQLPYIDLYAPGAMLISTNRVEEIQLEASATIGDFILVFGKPRWVSTWHANNRAEIILNYPDPSLTLTVNVPCPINRHAFWQARPDIRIEPLRSSSTMFTSPLVDSSLSC